MATPWLRSAIPKKVVTLDFTWYLLRNSTGDTLCSIRFYIVPTLVTGTMECKHCIKCPKDTTASNEQFLK
ncbi:hypothetical protein HOLleu_32351 [Holothuria leucospilota]|uniref:Uncharacterized protein n=1 Tax=Holothuria leucospilota TaxID=206669 RepID=A0A9Q0YTZ0_HOLLE|nr:hypothetical protein HOLleu_32351 [Holothuria leucospilota]